MNRTLVCNVTLESQLENRLYLSFKRTFDDIVLSARIFQYVSLSLCVENSPTFDCQVVDSNSSHFI